MMTSSNGNIFRVTGHLCREFTGPAQRPVTRSFDVFFDLICVWINGWVNNREAGDLKRYRAHYDVIVMYKWVVMNILHPVYCVAIVCHQIRFMYWGHLCMFYRVKSHLNWYKLVCMGDLAYRFGRSKLTDMFRILHLYCHELNSSLPFKVYRQLVTFI